MRAEARNAIRFALIAATAAITGAICGCAPRIQVGFDAATDFSRFRTWDWAPRETPAVEAPDEDEARLEARLSRSIEGGFRSLGYARDLAEADLRVLYDLSLERRQEVVSVPRAPYLLSSMSSSPSYWIEGTDTERRFYRELRLEIAVLGRDGRVVWKGGVQKRLEAADAPDLREAVRELLDRFPSARHPPPPSPNDRVARRSD